MQSRRMATGRMTTRRAFVPYGALLCGALLLAACSGGGGTNTTTTQTTATTQPTATPKPGPTTAPTVTQAFCQSALTVDEANQIMSPAIPATTIVVNSTAGELGVCHYTSSGATFDVLKILIDYKLYTGPKPVPDATIQQLVAELAGDPGATVTSTAAVTGVGDQAEFLAANASEEGQTFYADVIYVIDGQVVFLCDDFQLNTKPDDATQQSALTQCAQHVVSVL